MVAAPLKSEFGLKRNDPLSVGTVGRLGIFAATCCFLLAAPTLNPQTDAATHAHGHGADTGPGVSGVKHTWCLSIKAPRQMSRTGTDHGRGAARAVLTLSLCAVPPAVGHGPPGQTPAPSSVGTLRIRRSEWSTLTWLTPCGISTIHSAEQRVGRADYHKQR